MNHRYGRAAIIGIALASLLHEASKPRELSTLPNTEGFKFTGHKLDGSKLQCVVMRERHGGAHYAARRVDGVRIYPELRAWSPEEL